MEKASTRGFHTIVVKDDKGKSFKAVLEIKFDKMVVRPPIGKKSNTGNWF
jgi:hypothetical protein